MIQHDRGQYVTQLVIEWLAGDAPVREETAQILARPGKGAPSEFGSLLWRRIRTAPRGTNAWFLSQELAENDCIRIAWAEVASSVRDC
uniref:hypothetical protein n=1 Tax=Amycolatopsis sp. CA-096443 TaxID=3239919 RepID=UPI003F49153E